MKTSEYIESLGFSPLAFICEFTKKCEKCGKGTYSLFMTTVGKVEFCVHNDGINATAGCGHYHKVHSIIIK